LTHERTLVLRGLSPRLLKTYLVKLGAIEVSAGRFEHARWAVDLVARKVHVFNSVLDEVEVRFEGTDQAVTQAIAQLRKKTLRGGG